MLNVSLKKSNDSDTSQNYTLNDTVTHPRTTQVMTQWHTPELHK